ncbi:hypothetical protein [Pedobacter glucosidilyticus]|uniref:hypothetical protein n=1 Tax=Pedobacter glucosidilyticus TaxID=1122941 RepID=UPI0026EBB59B|nr:hypothetical protein [Pedobacter glucosidilyticus]
MKSIFTLIFACVLCTSLKAQPWSYNFGSQKGVFSNTVVSSSSKSNLLKPASGGVARLRHIDSIGYAEYVQQANGSALRMNASATGSGTKFSIYDFPATTVLDLSFKLRFETGSSGSFFIGIGNHTTEGSFFSNNSNVNQEKDKVFTGLRIDLKANPVNHTLRYIEGTTYTGISSKLNPIVALENSKDYQVQILCNNSTNTATYQKSGSNYTIEPQKYHVWINGIQILKATADANFSVYQASAKETNLNAFGLFFNNTKDKAAALVDDFIYSNKLP